MTKQSLYFYSAKERLIADLEFWVRVSLLAFIDSFSEQFGLSNRKKWQKSPVHIYQPYASGDKFNAAVNCDPHFFGLDCGTRYDDTNAGQDRCQHQKRSISSLLPACFNFSAPLKDLKYLHDLNLIMLHFLIYDSKT